MTNIADRLPPDWRRRYSKQCVSPGSVLHLFCAFTAPHKNKFLALAFLSADGDTLMFVINSKVPWFVQNSPALLSCQIKMNSLDYPFLDHDSYIDCARARDAFAYEDIECQIVDDPTRIKGELTPNTKSEVLNAVRSACTLSRHHKRLIQAALR